MEEKKVSVIVPVYNVEKYLEACVKSLVSQTYQNLEILLVDDGSLDHSGAICDVLAEKDSRVRVFHQENGGAGRAKNTALEAATGDYIGFSDSDDLTEPDYIKHMVDLLENTGADIVECGFSEMRKSCKTAVDNQPEGMYTAKAFLERFIFDWKCSLFCNKLFRAELLKNLRFYEGRVIDDEFYTYKAVIGAKTIVVSNESLYVYRQRKTSVTNQGRWKQRLLDRLAYITERYDLVTEAYPELKAIYLENLADNLIRIKNEVTEFPDLTTRVNKTMICYAWKILAGPTRLGMKYDYLRSMLLRGSGEWSSEEHPDWEDFFD